MLRRSFFIASASGEFDIGEGGENGDTGVCGRNCAHSGVQGVGLQAVFLVEAERGGMGVRGSLGSPLGLPGLLRAALGLTDGREGVLVIGVSFHPSVVSWTAFTVCLK